MNTIVITEQGSHLTKRGGQIVLFKEGNKIYVNPLANVRQIFLIGRIELSNTLIGYALRNQIDIAFLAIDGRYKGRIAAPQSKNVFVRQKQFDRLGDGPFKLAFSRRVVLAKANNYGRMVQKKAAVAYESFKDRLNNLRKSIEVADSLDTLRGLEGSFSALYFRHLPAMLIESFGFRKRQKHPPPDPLNILLSFSYTLLFNTVYAFVEAAGLDPYCGFFHDLKYGHPALASDLMEEFRAPVADSLVISLINNKLITADHFLKENENINFSRDGVAILYEHYRKRLTEKFAYKDMRLNFMQIIEQQVQHFVRVLKGEEDSYEGYVSR